MTAAQRRNAAESRRRALLIRARNLAKFDEPKQPAKGKVS
jgi:hypothetical protein